MGSHCKRVAYFRLGNEHDTGQQENDQNNNINNNDNENKGLELSQLDGTLFTHLVIAFARLDSNGNLQLAHEEHQIQLKQVPGLKRRFKGLKVMISVFNEPEHCGLAKAAASLEVRQRFARSAIEFLQKFQLDGLDINWQFPNFSQNFIINSREHERTGLTKIIKSLRSAMVENFFDRQVAEQHQQQQTAAAGGSACGDAQSGYCGANGSLIADRLSGTNSIQLLQTESQVEPYLLTLAVAGQENLLKTSYELKQLASLCDWLNVMSFDYFLFKAYAPFTGPNAPLNPIVDLTFVPYLSKLSFSWTLSKLLEEEIPRDKIVMGIPTYGRAYRLMFKSSQPASAFSLAIGTRLANRLNRHQDYVDYGEICDILNKPDTIQEFDARARVPYLLTDDGYTWISYENPQSVREKVRFILDKKLAGYMTWSLDCDSFRQADQHQDAGSKRVANGRQQAVGEQQVANFALHRAMLEETKKGIEAQVNGLMKSG